MFLLIKSILMIVILGSLFFCSSLLYSRANNSIIKKILKIISIILLFFITIWFLSLLWATIGLIFKVVSTFVGIILSTLILGIVISVIFVLGKKIIKSIKK